MGNVITGVLTGAMGRLALGARTTEARLQTERNQSRWMLRGAHEREVPGDQLSRPQFQTQPYFLLMVSEKFQLSAFPFACLLGFYYGHPKELPEGGDSQFTERLHVLFCLDSVSHATPGRGQGGIITYILWPKKPRQ